MSGICLRKSLKEGFGLDGPTSAWRRILRCSSSMEMPCKPARSLSFLTTVSSICLTMSCGIMAPLRAGDINDSTPRLPVQDPRRPLAQGLWVNPPSGPDWAPASKKRPCGRALMPRILGPQRAARQPSPVASGSRFLSEAMTARFGSQQNYEICELQRLRRG